MRARCSRRSRSATASRNCRSPAKAPWTSHFDEGYYGAWEGSAALVGWDPPGRVAFQLPDTEGLSGDHDVVALNVGTARDTWFIGAGAPWHLHERRLAGAWSLAGAGSKAFAIEGQDLILAAAWGLNVSMRALLGNLPAEMLGRDTAAARLQAADEMSAMLKLHGLGVQWGDERDEATEQFGISWVKLHDSGNTTVEGDFVLRTREGEPIEPTKVIGRGDRLVVLAGDAVHELGVADVVAR